MSSSREVQGSEREVHQVRQGTLSRLQESSGRKMHSGSEGAMPRRTLPRLSR